MRRFDRNKTNLVHSISPTMLIITLLCSFVVLVVGQENYLWRKDYMLDFSYDTDANNGPRDWESVDTYNSEYEQFTSIQWHLIFDLELEGNVCESELRPSPIALDINDNECPDEHDIRTRRITSRDCKKDDITFEITPHALRAYYPYHDLDCYRPTIMMDGSDSPFLLVWMELHARSEHVVDGKRYDAELQMVHMGTRNSNDEMATVSVLIDASADRDHPEFQFLLDQWQSVADAEEDRCEKRRANRKLRENVRKGAIINSIRKKKTASKQNSKDILDSDNASQFHRRDQYCNPNRQSECGPRRRMFPYSLWPSIWYFRYSGGLTTPPCSSIVNWRIIDAPMLISRKQFRQLAKLQASYRNDECDPEPVLTPQGENFRPLQEGNSNRQPVSHCTSQHFDESLYLPGNQ
mmetsp:Transcript_21318/g.32352  ORF Transcript_21318/g.32352 Transcript_21318/m.32352 type:complete len:408 (+) Transcript_21318:19-1242(+)